MELKDFTEQEQKQIEKGLSTAEISDKEAAKKLLALVPQEWIKRIPFFVRGHATTKTVERVAKQYPELYAVAKRQGDLPEKEGQELRKIMTSIFESRIRITICEGRFHQIKRMFEKVGKTVVYLKRLSMGSLELDPALPKGSARLLTQEEKAALGIADAETQKGK